MKREEEKLTGKMISAITGSRISEWKVLFSIVIILLPLILSSAGGSMKDMNFDEFREYLKSENADEIEVVFDGTETPAPVTGNKYVFNQIVTYCGEENIRSSYRTWNSSDEFILVYKNIKVSLSHPKVRTFIEETGLFEEKDIDDGRVLPSVEFGLIKDKKYYAKISSEEYHLPPDREDGKPRKKVNYVLWISSKPYKNGKPQVELTPIYKGWSY